MKLEISNFYNAFKLLSEIIHPSPLIKNQRLSDEYGANIFLKLENMLPVGSFKMRGASYKISQLSDEQKRRGVLAVSAGNHAQGVAWASEKFGSEALIIMPTPSPLTKINRTQSLGAEVILHGENVDECFEYAKAYLKNHDLTYIPPFEDEDVIAGQGSVAFEILDQLKNVDFVFGSIGGGGLMSGVGTVFKELSPKTQIMGSQSSGARSMVESLKAGKIVVPRFEDTFADGVKVKKASETMRKILARVVDEAIHVPDSEIAMAILALLEKAHLQTEGAGALPLAMFHNLYKQDPTRFEGKNVVLIICGGNIDINLIGRIVDIGLVASGRRASFRVYMADRPGSLAYLSQKIADCGANILQVQHDRRSPRAHLNEAIIDVTIETKGANHLNSVYEKMKKEFNHIEKID